MFIKKVIFKKNFNVVMLVIVGKVLSMFSQRIQAQFQQFQAFVASLNIERDENLGGNEDTKNGEELTRDQFDLRKIIVVVSSSGKLFGLDTLGKYYMF